MSKKIAFLGSTKFSKRILENLFQSKKFSINLIITPVDSKYSRKKIIIHNELFLYAKTKDIEVIQTNNVNNIIDILISKGIELCITCAFGQFLNSLFLSKFQVINIHPSILPKYRGGAPINWALINGDDKTGISIMESVKEMDAGPIYKLLKVPILPNDNFESLENRIINELTPKISNIIDKIISNELTKKPQKGKITFGLNITKKDLIIDLSNSSEQIYNKIRGLSNRGAILFFKNQNFKITNANKTDIKVNDNCKDGLFYKNKKLLLPWSDYFLDIQRIQPPNKKMLTGQEFINGFKAIIKKI